MTTQINYQPQGAVLDRFHRSNQYGRIIIGPLGSGKTFACIVEIFRQILAQPPDNKGVRRSRILCVRNTHPELQSTTIKDFQEVAEKINFQGDWKYSAPTTWSTSCTLADCTTVEAEILFLAFDDASDTKKARGLQLSGVYFNELKELNKANVDIVLGRVGRYPNKEGTPNRKKFFIADSNAPDRDHWLAKMCFDEETPAYEFFLQPGGLVKAGKRWKRNPLAENLVHLDADYYVLNQQSRKDSWIRQNLVNEFVYHSDGRPVHPDFNEVMHVRDIEIHPALALTVGIDFGRTPAAAICQKQEDGWWYVLDELCTENMGALKFGKLLNQHLDQEEYRGLPIEFVGDPAGSQMAQTRDETPFDMLKQAGIDAIPAPGHNDFEERTTALDELLTQLLGGEPALQVHPRCKTLIRGLVGEYQFKRIRVAGDERYHDKPLKNSASHVCEALHYGLLGGGAGILTRRKPRKRDWEVERDRREAAERRRAYE